MTPTRAIERTWELFNNVTVDLGFMHISLFTYVLVPIAISSMLIFFKLALKNVSFVASSGVDRNRENVRVKNAKKQIAHDTYNTWLSHQTIDKGR